jgi:uncharacterized protein (DUF2141 family)
MKGLRKRVVRVFVASALILGVTVAVGGRPSIGPRTRPLTADAEILQGREAAGQDMSFLRDLPRIAAPNLTMKYLLPVSSGVAPRLLLQPTQIHVAVVGLRNNKGQVLCSLFSSAIAFPQKDDKAVAHYAGEISDRQAFCEFPGIAPGTYAVSAFHDENSNGKLDTNFMGIPREGVAASNDARGRLGSPKFNDAAFQVSGDQVNLRITITYLKVGRL